MLDTDLKPLIHLFCCSCTVSTAVNGNHGNTCIPVAMAGLVTFRDRGMLQPRPQQCCASSAPNTAKKAFTSNNLRTPRRLSGEPTSPEAYGPNNQPIPEC